jgi:hypothetical protein
MLRPVRGIDFLDAEVAAIDRALAGLVLASRRMRRLPAARCLFVKQAARDGLVLRDLAPVDELTAWVSAIRSEPILTIRRSALSPRSERRRRTERSRLPRSSRRRKASPATGFGGLPASEATRYVLASDRSGRRYWSRAWPKYISSQIASSLCVSTSSPPRYREMSRSPTNRR